MKTTPGFVGGMVLPSRGLRKKRERMQASYLSPSNFNVDFGNFSKNGNFGAVFFGEYADPSCPENATDVVVKCPVESNLGRQLYEMEKYTNIKLQRKCDEKTRFAEYVGELIIPPESSVVSGLVRCGLVWRKMGTGDTLESYLSSSRIGQLASLLGTVATPAPLRRELTQKVLRELALTVKDLHSCGIVHRDVKPENLLVVPGDPTGALLKAIDFGSSCDWSSPFKKGLGLATCDPVYAAPEKRLDIFKPAFRFDVYSIGLIALRCAVPSLTDEAAMTKFVTETLSACRFSFLKACSAIIHGRVSAPQDLVSDIRAITGPAYEDMCGTLAVMLTEDPKDRADVEDCLNSRFLRSSSL